MRVRTVAALSAMSMLLSSYTVWSVTSPDPRWGKTPKTTAERRWSPEKTQSASSFSDGTRVKLEGRLGHRELRSGEPQETFALFSIQGSDAGRGERAPMHLAIVLDRSGSMAGKKLDNALAAARGAIGRLSDRDFVSVVEYSTQARLLVSPTRVDGDGRSRVLSQLSGITAEGDTCISCALATSVEALRLEPNLVERVLLLSDGEATTGAKDIASLGRAAEAVRLAGGSVTTVGVDVDYNERVMAEIARDSNGRHYFVENPGQLAQVFDREIDGLERAVAREANLELEVPAGVEVDEVLDRSFRREGQRVIVPLGAISANEEKTVLVRLRVREGDSGDHELVSARLRYEDALDGSDGESIGRLAALFGDDVRDEPLDPAVEERVRRSSTVGVLSEANDLFSKGDGRGARDKLERSLTELKASRSAAIAAAPAEKKKDLDENFAKQEAALGAAASAFAAPPAAADDPLASRAGKAAVKSNQAAASELAF